MQPQRSQQPWRLNRANLGNLFAQVSANKVSGELILTQGQEAWSFFFLAGRFLFATHQNGRVRRWHRALGQHHPEFRQAKLQTLRPTIPWEYQLLVQGLTEKQISQPQARAIIVTIAQEVMFTLLCRPEMNGEWVPEAFKMPLIAWVPLDREVYQPVQQLLANGRYLPIYNALRPEKCPYLADQTGPEVHELAPLLTGKSCFWDIAQARQLPITQVIDNAVLLFQRGLLRLRNPEDLEIPLMSSTAQPAKIGVAPSQAQTMAAVQPESVKPDPGAPSMAAPRIACIDDSRAMGLVLEKLLVPAGYAVYKIHNPLAEMPALMASQPHLILLDLMMPDVDGYSLCTFLRKTPMFRNVPIVILTSNGGFIDRTRALSVGASGFLSKPPEPRALLETVRKFVNC